MSQGPYQLPRRSLPPGFGPSPQFPQGYPGAQPSQFNPQQQQQLPNPIQQQPQRHAGLGAPGAAANLPPPPNLAQGSSSYGSNPQFVGEKWTLFVGSVADGVDAGWLERILNAPGPVLSIRRPTPAFAFVEYGDAETVLRCLELLNGALLTGKGGVEKAMLVKADEKTRARLDEYEATRVKNEQTTELLLQAKEEFEGIARLIKSGEAPTTSTLALTDGRKGPPERSLTHLQDLAPEDLPETSREVITSEIALFRVRALRHAEEKKRMDALADLKRNGGRNLNQQQHAQAQSPGGFRQQQGKGWVPRGPAAQQNAQDPQSFNKPVGFVAADGSSGAPAGPAKAEVRAAPTISDEDRERDRAAKERREADAMYRDLERRLEGREKSRIGLVERERAKERATAGQEDRERVVMREKLATWDDEKEAEKSRELFYSDRVRWRVQRRAIRQRELDADLRDRNAEAQQLAALHKQSEDFLAQQADMFARITESKNRANIGALLPRAGADDEPAVKLSFGNVAPKAVTKPAAPIRSAVLGSTEDDEDGKKKRELIPLSYSDDEDDKPTKPSHRLTGAERERKSREIYERIPSAKESLWIHKMPWSALSETLIRQKLSPLASKTIVSHLGSEEEELLNAVVDHVRAHKGAAELVEELEPVLDEEATEFVRTIWRQLAYELALAHAGLS